jgi:hypothetical protein
LLVLSVISVGRLTNSSISADAAVLSAGPSAGVSHANDQASLVRIRLDDGP